MLAGTHLLIAMAAALGTAGGAQPGFDVAPAPGWVDRAPLDPGRAPPADATEGVYDLLVDDQVKVAAQDAARYHRVARRVLSVPGVERGSELRIDFDPAYQRLVLHEVAIVRGGERIDALRREEVRLLQRETGLERRVYDGRLTAVLFLRDVRVGDVVDCAYTVIGTNPVLAGRYADGFALAQEGPVGRRSVRLLWPAARRGIAYRTHGIELAPETVPHGSEIERRWVRTDVPGAQRYADVPPGADAVPWLQVSELGSWGEVARWAAALFAPGPRAPALAAQVEPWRQLPSGEARALAALRFVQDEVRYLGIELGPGSHRPRGPADVLAQRFGDCKDKALLLVELLRALGFRADVALVHTGWREALDRRLPSPFDFDHAIVRLELDGVEHWVDPTRSLERGSLAARPAPPFRRALIVDAHTRELAVLPEPRPSRVEAETTYRIERFGRPVKLLVRTRYEGERATEMRRVVAERPRAELDRYLLDLRSRASPGARTLAPAVLSDDEDANAFTVDEQYLLPAAHRDGRLGVTCLQVLEALDAPSVAGRSVPLAVEHPVLVHEAVSVELPGTPDLARDHRYVEGPAGGLVLDVRPRDTSVSFELEYRSLAPSVGVSGLERQARAVRAMQEVASFWVSLRLARTEGGDTFYLWLIGAILLVPAAFVMFWILEGASLRGVRERLRRVVPARLRRAPPAPRGATPATAFVVCDDAALTRHVQGLVCRCGARLVGAERAGAVEGSVQRVVARCTCCGGAWRFFYRLGADDAAA